MPLRPARVLNLIVVLVLSSAGGCSKSDSLAKSLESKGVRLTRNMQDQVTAIQFNEHEPTDEELATFCGISGIREVSLSGKKISEAGWDALKQCESLETIHVSDALSKAVIAALANKPTLKSVSIKNAASVDDASLSALETNTGLTSLKLTNTSVSDAGLQLLDKLTELTVLDLSGTPVGNAGVDQIVKALPKLNELHLNATKVDAAGAEKIAGLKQLTHLSLRGCNLTNECLAGAATCATLRVLDLGENPALTDSGILSLGVLASLVSLDVSESAFTGVGFNQAGFTNLASLKANGTQVADTAIPDFLIKTMYSLSLERTAVTESGVRAVFAPNHQTAVAFDKQ